MKEVPPIYGESYCQEYDEEGILKPEILDQNKWCKECNEVATFCTECVNPQFAAGTSTFDQEFNSRQFFSPTCELCTRPLWDDVYPELTYFSQ